MKCAPAKNKKINEVLTQIRVLELFGQNFHIKPHYEDVVYWNLAEGRGADGKKYDEILGNYDGTLSRKLSEGLYLGLTEAMTNTRHHAYPNVEPHEYSEWWMFSQEKDGFLTVAICDLGIGIPTSLPQKQPGIWKKIQTALNGSVKDSEMIDGAIKYKKTRTGMKHRGKGLTQLTEVMDNTENSRLFIFSNKGCYARSANDVKLHDYDESIGGTIVTWTLPLPTNVEITQ